MQLKKYKKLESLWKFNFRKFAPLGTSLNDRKRFTVFHSTKNEEIVYRFKNVVFFIKGKHVSILARYKFTNLPFYYYYDAAQTREALYYVFSFLCSVV